MPPADGAWNSRTADLAGSFARAYLYPVQQILVYSDSLSWGIVPGSRQRLEFAARWPGVLENTLNGRGRTVRVIEDCLNGRRTVWEDPFKPGRNGLTGLAQRMEIHSPLALVILMLGSNDFQSMHPHRAWHAALGIGALVAAIRTAPIEPGMPVPPVLIVAPPVLQEARGVMARKFSGAAERSAGLAAAYREISSELGCPFVDAGGIVEVSAIDGIHLDREQHAVLGNALASVVAELPLAPGA
jgi:lysophospholipase L1-like esterase